MHDSSMTGLSSRVMGKSFQLSNGQRAVDFIERVRQLVRRRHKIIRMLDLAKGAGANFIGVPRTITDGPTVICVGMKLIAPDLGQNNSYRFYYVFDRDLARILEVIMRKKHIIIVHKRAPSAPF